MEARGVPNPGTVGGRNWRGSLRNSSLYSAPLLPASCGQPGEPQVWSHPWCQGAARTRNSQTACGSCAAGGWQKDPFWKGGENSGEDKAPYNPLLLTLSYTTVHSFPSWKFRILRSLSCLWWSLGLEGTSGSHHISCDRRFNTTEACSGTNCCLLRSRLVFCSQYCFGAKHGQGHSRASLL